MTYGWTGNASTREATAAGSAAVRYASRLPPEERSLVIAYRMFQEGKTAATDSMLRYTAAHPGDADGWYLLGESRYHTRRTVGYTPAELMEPFDRVLELDPSLTPAVIHPLEVALELADTALFEKYMRVLRSAGAATELARFEPVGRFVFEGTVDSSVARAFSGNRLDAASAAIVGVINAPHEDVSEIATRLETLEQLVPAGQNMSRQLPQMRALVHVGMGQLGEARRMADTAAPDSRAFLLMTPIFGGFAPPGYADSLVAELEAGRPRTPPRPVTNPFELYFRAMFHLGQGNADSARPYVQRGIAMDSATLARYGGDWLGGLQQLAHGWITIVDGDTTTGIARIEAGLERVGNFGGPAMTAPARLQRAIALSRRPATRERGISLLQYGFPYDPQYRPVAQVAIAEALQAAGDRQGAERAYAEFLRYWAHADPAFAPRVESVRAALAALQRQGG